MAIEVTREDILSALEKLGVADGDRLIVHSSLSSFGRVVGGAASVITALQHAVGDGGIIMMPTFTYGHEPFDLRRSPSKTGYITECFRLSPHVVRSEHPGFSVAVWGGHAGGFAEGHTTEAGIGRGGPLHRLIERGGKILLIGVDQTANSSIHLAQDLARAPYLNRYRMTERVEADGTRRPSRIRRAGCSRGFNRIQPFIDRAGIETRLMIGESTARLMPGAALLDLAIELLRRDPAIVLCERDDCPSCAEAREMIAAAQAKGCPS